jgi:hypothetical protein
MARGGAHQDRNHKSLTTPFCGEYVEWQGKRKTVQAPRRSQDDPFHPQPEESNNKITKSVKTYRYWSKFHFSKTTKIYHNNSGKKYNRGHTHMQTKHNTTQTQRQHKATQDNTRQNNTRQDKRRTCTENFRDTYA